MKTCFILLCTLFFLSMDCANAIGGGRGGGGGKGGSAHLQSTHPQIQPRQQQIARPSGYAPSLSMSRADVRPGNIDAQRSAIPSRDQLQQFLGISKIVQDFQNHKTLEIHFLK